MEVWCGMIIGFDNDDETIFDAQIQFIREAADRQRRWWGCCTRSPGRPCTTGSPAEGRLDMAEEPEFGTNVIPLRLSREAMRDGYIRVLSELYEPSNYFARLEELYITRRLDQGRARSRYWRRHPLNAIKTNAMFLTHALGLFLSLMHGIPDRSLRREYRRRLGRLIRARPNDPGSFLVYTVQVRHALSCL